MEKPIKIKTLSEILADMGQPVSANIDKPPADNTPIDDTFVNPTSVHHSPTPNPPKPKKSTKQPQRSAVAELLNNESQSVLDDETLELLGQVEIEALALPDKQTRYLRWLAFYYLSKRELSQHELRAKLLAKDCDKEAVEALLCEFADKGYQSDERCATMLVREAVRKGRGVHHIQDALKKARLNAKDFGGLDELIEMAGVDTLTDGTILDNDDDKDDINWLKLAVEARCKKYGNHIPTDPKEKARQLRFLQYRGYQMGVCLEALKMTVGDF